MGGALEQKFLLRFDGHVWNILADETALLIELRDPVKKVVTFSAFSMDEERFLWKEKQLEETWWINGTSITSDKVIFTIYLDTNNPDKKGVVVYSLRSLKLIWWNNDFSVSEMGTRTILGFSSRLGLKEVVLDLETGSPMDRSYHHPAKGPLSLHRPVQYSEGMPHFETVRNFLADRLNFSAVSALEYLEAQNSIMISSYCAEGERLANYLFVLSAEGKVLLKEKLETQLKGIGLDTFFVLKGCVIFVRNKVELVSYKLL